VGVESGLLCLEVKIDGVGIDILDLDLDDI
jgi:hypothetical protein